MAYISQEEKKLIAPKIKEILKKYKLKGTIKIENHSTITLTIREGAINFLSLYNESMNNQPGGFCQNPNNPSYLDINKYWMHLHFDGETLNCLNELHDALKGDNYFDESDSMTDYFHVKHYYYVKIGAWNKPYKLIN